MKFGGVANPEIVDFTLPEDHHDTGAVLGRGQTLQDIYVGCARWNRNDLKTFYPKGTRDELNYYATQFNSIEMNTTFYGHVSESQVAKWRSKVPESFKFFPKVHRYISHIKRLKDHEGPVERFCSSMRTFERQLGMVFLQLHDNFKPKNMDRLVDFVESWPKDIPLSIELRNTEWFNNAEVANQVYQLFQAHRVTNIITDTAGRRDLLHMRLTTPNTFIRYVGANHPSDYDRLDDWVQRLEIWVNQGLENIYFFIHQNMEKESPLLAAHFVKLVNQTFGKELIVPKGTT